MTHDHRACDDLWIAVENAAGEEDLTKTRAAFEAFDAALRHHLAFEEQTLFPAIDAAIGSQGMGPTGVMRSEHEQMRRMLGTMATALAAGDLGGVLDHGDTLLMLLQQHNSKEESVLYPIADARIAEQWEALKARF
jgi:iron-sulfur cluster repair protein YtfE (RIC family)